MKWLAVAFMFAGSVVAQTTQTSKAVLTPNSPTINIGIDLQLGMCRDAIITQLAANYKVVKVQGDGDDWLVEDKQNPITTFGLLGFHAGKLTYASRDWTQGQEDNYAFAQALWGAMSQMDKEGHHTCSFDVPNTRSPTTEISNVRFYCGKKTIDITIINIFNGSGPGHYTSISEVLSSEEFR
jgi:hypothetical protein